MLDHADGIAPLRQRELLYATPVQIRDLSILKHLHHEVGIDDVSQV